jgi:tRNA pseudouridine55 synthase
MLLNPMHVIKAWKHIGETPLQTMDRIRADHHLHPGLKSCYTGRLDPMAQGQITLLFGDMIYQAQRYNHASKTYRFQAILGISTTSYDPMGRITSFRQIQASEAERFRQEMLKVVGPIIQPLPPCSAYRYKGKPLWRHMKEGTLPEPLPSRPVTILSMNALHDHPTQIDFSQYRAECLDDILDVKKLNPGPNSFQYPEIIDDWESQTHMAHVWRIGFEVKVSSGTFVRALVHDLGVRLGIPAHAFRITRTRSEL